MGKVVDTVPTNTREHFKEAFQSARRSVTVHDLYKFNEFRKKWAQPTPRDQEISLRLMI